MAAYICKFLSYCYLCCLSTILLLLYYVALGMLLITHNDALYECINYAKNNCYFVCPTYSQ